MNNEDDVGRDVDENMFNKCDSDFEKFRRRI